MKVINPNNSIHNLFLSPRAFVSNAKLWIRNELRDIEETINVTCEQIYGFVKIEFTKTVAEGQSFEFELLTTDNELLYRGKIYVTSQETQNYRL